MGISGLLLALKSIQVTKHLSELSGQTIAVDAYVWLHKAVYSCATELATGEPTCKYVNYAMERVRILRHHGIEPYIVFDGGPLQAKQGTESGRKEKRKDYIAKGNIFMAQGNKSAARECYTKAIDVTPQMAFQLIKALRAEGVKYVVAPYEADAQLAFLERKGLVSAILTEDSDLLVFGCRNVLFKFDSTARTVVSISQADFASVTPSAEANSISLVGWSDKQFREMAILSGCDYLPSIPGVGLKTACTMLRKWKTPEQVVRSIMLDGKKAVPKGYIQRFRLAEKCFLYQRVYDPELERLVHLNDVPNGVEWDETVDAFVGRDLEPVLAKGVALGDNDPVSYETMKDINPNFVPRTRVLRELPLSKSSMNRTHMGNGKTRDTAASEGILSFFGPNPKIPQMPQSPTAKTKGAIGGKIKMVIGKESGKRTLPDIHDEDVHAKRRKTSAKTDVRSKFFGSAVVTPMAGKENEHTVVDDHDEVEQEDGYISPTPSLSRDTQELSSPPRPSTAPQLGLPPTGDLDFGAETISSPPSGRSRRRAPVWPPIDPKRSWAVDLRNSFGDEFTEAEGEAAVVNDEQEQRTMASRNAAVAAGWRNMWGLRRSETNVTPNGRHRLGGRYSTSHAKTPDHNSGTPKGRRSLIFFESKSKIEANPESSMTSVKVDEGRSVPVQKSEVDAFARARLEKFRLVTR